MRSAIGCLVVIGGCASPAPPTQPASDPALPPAPTPVVEPTLSKQSDAAPEVDKQTSDALLAATAPLAAPKDWPTDIPWVTDSELAFDNLIVSKAGDIAVQWSVPGTVTTELSARLVSALVTAGYKRTAPCHLPSSKRCELTLKGRRVALHGAKENLELHLLPAKLAPPAKLPGRCRVPPTRKRSVRVYSSGIKQDGERFHGERTWSVDTSVGIDIDSDGTLEVYVPHTTKGRCPWDIPHDVYVMRGTCGHRVGTIVGDPRADTRFAPIVGGLRTLTTTAEWATSGPDSPIPIAHTRTRRYTFDGKRLRLKSDDDQTGRCHHCAKSYCTPASP